MGKKLLHILIIFSYMLFIPIFSNCYADNKQNSPLPPPPPANTSNTSSQTSADNPADQNAENANIVDKLFDKAGYQYFKINKDIDSEKDYPKLFNIPDGNDDEGADVDDLDINN